jgi:chemotaxis protein MotB
MEEKKLIIKKVKKGHGGGHHGGSWKVAYADFVTAMMAFFLLMWLLNMSSPEQKAELSYYFSNFSLFEKGGGKIRSDITGQEDAMQLQIEMDASPSYPPAEDSDSQSDSDFAEEGKNRLEKLKEQLEREIEERLLDVKDQIRVEIFEGGVRVDILDKTGNPMFPLGSPELTNSAKNILSVISSRIKNSAQKIEIEGHTDALNYADKHFSNWELSTARASAARIELEKNGFPPSRVLRISGYAATLPIIKNNPNDPRNRRISLLLFMAPPNTNKPASSS